MGRHSHLARRPSPTSPSAPASRARPSPTRSTTPTCSAPTPCCACRRRSRTSATCPTGRPATCAPAPRHLVGLRMSPVQEGTANAAMDRFVHSLVWTSREAGYHVLLFSGEGPDPLAGYDDLLRSTAVDAFVVTDTYLGNPQAAWLRERRAPFVAFGRPWDDPAAQPPLGRRRRRGRHRAGHPAPARQGPHPDRVDRLAQGLLDRRGPPLRLEPRPARARPARPPAWPPGSRTPSGAVARRAAACSTRRSPPRSSAPPTPWPWACSTPSPSAACTRAATSRSSASTTPRSPRSCTPASPRCASRSRRSPIAVVDAARGAPRHAAARARRAAAHPDADACAAAPSADRALRRHSVCDQRLTA